MSSALEGLPFADLFISTDNVLNTLILHAINRGAITR